MEHYGNPVRPEASADEHASSFNPAPPTAPAFATDEEAEAFWRGVSHGIRSAGRDVSHPHMPPDFPIQLARDGAAPGLISNTLLDTWPHVPGDEASNGMTSHGPAAPPPASASAASDTPPSARHDGITPAVEQHFLRILAETGVVADACRATGFSRQAFYHRRNSAAGRAFALAWDAALLLSRRAIADDVMGRARHGVIERVYRNGELVAERHKYDNRLTMAVLTRLDRMAEGLGPNAPAVNAVADEFDQFLGLLPRGLEEAADFVAARCPEPAVRTAAQATGNEDSPAQGGEKALLDRLATYAAFGAGLPGEIDTDDLDPAFMESWTDDQFGRAVAADYFRGLEPADWPAAARDAAADGTDGMCKVRQYYVIFGPAPRAAPEPAPADDFSDWPVWEDEEHGWLTSFPPPPGFGGYEEGDPAGDGYRRELAPDERAVFDAAIAADAAARPDPHAEREAARRRCFELGEPAQGDDGEEEEMGAG